MSRPDNVRRIQAAIASCDRALSETEIAAKQQILERKLYEMTWLPWQKQFLDACNSEKYFGVCATSANQNGKSWVHVGYGIAESFGYQPWDGRPRKRTDYDLALLLRDYDNHARKVLHQNFFMMLPKHCVRVETTQKGAPRIITPTDPITGIQGKPIHIFTHDQDWDRLEGATWQWIGIDEPCPRSHFMGLIRGLQQTGGMFTMTMTPLSEPWIFDEVYSAAENVGGTNKRYFSITAFPDENLKSRGGFLNDQNVHDFRGTMSQEEKEARVHGRWMHLVGRVFKEFQEDIHVVPHEQILEAMERDPAAPIALTVDPQERVPWAMSWSVLLPDDEIYIFDEFPQEPIEQIHSHHYDLDFYAHQILTRPHPRFRIMDPFRGPSKTVTGYTYLYEMAKRSQPGRPLAFETEFNKDVAEGHQAVHDRLFYDLKKGIRPRLYVSDRCLNHIKAFRNYVWDDYHGKAAEGRARKPKPKERYKHFIDVVRYRCVFQIGRMPQFRDHRYEDIRNRPRPSWEGNPKQLWWPNNELNSSRDYRDRTAYNPARRYHGRI